MAELKDVRQMATLDQMCFAAPWSVESFRREIEENAAALYLVADWNGLIIGYVGLWEIVDEGHITNVAVHPDFRRNGIASQLLKLLITVTEQGGIVSHTLEVRPSNSAAIALYSGFEFHEAGRRKAYYEDNREDALIMWRHSSKNQE